ncbi:E3 ubiquitin-protein ligase RMA1H1-like [Rutidosis leptorrhynchoides]|uniref:E3 ubiquitin-protein ligase RMA1H1-like n=1 Tax=Rutidosis leptorrhynchoides TaxID=125765 RepID=UPI003A99DCFD
MDQHLQDLVPVNNVYKEDVVSQNKWKSSNESVDEFDNGPSGDFDCNICLDHVNDPVVTLCGHLYCWPCIYKWFHHQKTTLEHLDKKNTHCPVCKSEISLKSIVPLYGRGQTNETIPEEKSLITGITIPRRPSSPRSSMQNLPTQQPIHRTYQHASMPIAMASIRGMSMTNMISPTTGMLGEIVYEIFGNSQSSLYAYPNSYNLAGMSTQRARRQAIQADRSLSRICFFLLCCVMLCLVLF